ncbi:hypothetical protein GcM1_247128 [Golovinomyces cichoracearum]|uniref:Uncharacterized protein n=1 Tax=Golovinomyces cichoracearum TaxID=62708 RepID=A0A420IDP6_9PEZI|nr:hypothetical protein GcM1_247128 [Golovinomyces cichoracearum]
MMKLSNCSVSYSVSMTTTYKLNAADFQRSSIYIYIKKLQTETTESPEPSHPEGCRGREKHTLDSIHLLPKFKSLEVSEKFINSIPPTQVLEANGKLSNDSIDLSCLLILCQDVPLPMRPKFSNS